MKLMFYSQIYDFMKSDLELTKICSSVIIYRKLESQLHKVLCILCAYFMTSWLSVKGSLQSKLSSSEKHVLQPNLNSFLAIFTQVSELKQGIGIQSVIQLAFLYHMHSLYLNYKLLRASQHSKLSFNQRYFLKLDLQHLTVRFAAVYD